MTADLVPRHRRRCVIEEMDDETLIYRSPSETAIYLNETATVIWKLCDGTRTVQGIVDVLADAFPESASEIGADVREAIDELVSQGVLAFTAPVGAQPVADNDPRGDVRSE